MIFLGTTFCSGKYSIFPTASNKINIDSTKLQDGTYDSLLLSSNENATFQDVNSENWKEDTILKTSFDRSLNPGNNEFALKNTDTVAIKRREENSLKWNTIYIQKINNVEDFNISFIDKFAKQGIVYEYSISSFMNNVENHSVTASESILSDFNGFYVVDKDNIFGTMYNVEGGDTTRNYETSILSLLNNRFATVASNSEANYDSGSISGDFIQFNEYGDYDQVATQKYILAYKDRLTKRKPLILKTDDGRMWMIMVTGNISDSKNNHPNLRKIGFDWVEIGDPDDMETLYKNGFIDFESVWW